MNPKLSEVCAFGKQLIASFLSVILLINMAAPALAQEVPSTYKTKVRDYEKKFEEAYRKEVERTTFASESTNTTTPAMLQQRKTMEEYFSDPVIKQLMELRDAFIPQEINALNMKAAPKNDKQEFLTQYYAEITAQVQAANKQLKEMEQKQRQYINQELDQARQAGISDNVINTWLETENQKIQQVLDVTQAKIKSWQAQALKEADKQYEQAIALAETESHKIIASKIRELMDLYQKYPAKARPFLLDIALAVFMTDGKDTNLFTDKEKNLIHQLFLEDLHNGAKCGQKSTDCSRALTALTALGILGDSLEDSGSITEFIEAHWQTPEAAAILLTGVSALLAMQNYGAVRGLLDRATRKELDFTGDIISFNGIINGLITLDGQYLGEISKWAQFPIPEEGQVHALGNNAAGNAWEEIAYMLAEDGSEKALSVLRDYSINTCVVRPKMNFKNEFDIACGAIQPFLVGALLSEKAGKYSGLANMNLSEGYVMDNNGSRYVGAEEVARNRQSKQNMLRNMQAFAVPYNQNIPAAIAHSLYSKNMGDLDADNQWFLDHKLFAFFNKITNEQKNIDASLRIKPYGKDSYEYKAKQRSYNRGKVWLKVGTLADIAFLVWCAYDIVRLGAKAVTLGRSIYITTKMARSGATAAARASVLWKMKTARTLVKINRTIPMRIKEGMAGSVRNLLPQFTKVEPLLKAPNGVSLIPATQIALQTAKFSAQTGTFTWEAKNMASVLDLQPKMAQPVADLQKTLNLAADKANVEFAGRRGLLRSIIGDRDFRYRQYLANEIRQQGLNIYNAQERGRVIDFAAQIRADRSIGIPQKVYELKSTPLISKTGVVDPTAVRRITGPLLEGTTSSQRLEIKQALDMAQEQAGFAYANRGWWTRFQNGLFVQNKSVYNDLLANGLIGLRENDAVMASFSPLQKEQVLSSLASSIRLNKNISIPSNISQYAGREFNAPKLSYKTMKSALFSADKADQVLPIELHVDLGVKGVEANRYQRVMFTRKGNSYFMGMSDGIGKPVDLSRFKITIPTSNMPVLLRGSMDAGLAKPLELKLNVYKNAKAFQRAAEINGETLASGTKVRGHWLSNIFAGSRSQNKVFSHELPVYLNAANGQEMLAPVRVMADTRLKLEGGRFVLGTDNKLRLYKGKDLISDKLFYFSLPKRELGSFVQVATKGTLPETLRLTVNSGRNKILPLYISTGLSLSSASVGLIAPLETTYKDRITDTDKTLISLAFPYLPSLAAPALAPVVMRFGALRVVQAALASVTAGLAFTWAMGFNGQLDKNNLPPIWPLFVSGAAIGVSSALSRSGLNILIDTMGGGKSLLQSMMFKNLGSVVLLAPSWVYTWSKLSAKPKLTGKELSAEELAQPASDFSLAFPVLTVLTTGVLTYLTRARISPYIGRSAAVLNGEKMKFWSEMGRSLKTMVAPEVWPLASAAFFFTGFEAAAFSKASSQAFRPFYESRDFVNNSIPGNRSNTVSLLTGLSVAALPFTARFFAPKLLKSFSNPLKPASEYKKMLTLSYAMNTAGGLMLMKYGMDPNPNAAEMLLGISLMGLGTANVTQSLQKLANIKVGSGPTIARMVKGLPPAQAAQRATELKNITMTGFSWSQLGLAAIPLVQSSYVDREVAQGVSDGKGPLSSIWIPLSSLALSVGLASRSLGLNVSLPTLMRTWGVSKLAVDGISSFNPLPAWQTLQQENKEGTYNRLEFKINRYQDHLKDIQEKEAEEEKADQEQKTLVSEALTAQPLPLLPEVQKISQPTIRPLVQPAN